MKSLLLLFMLAIQANAQGPTRPTPQDAMKESQRQELDKLILRKPITETEDNSTRNATLKQINDDFKNLQVQNNNLIKSINEPRSNYCDIANLVSSINGRATRLKQNLSLPKAESGKDTKRSDQKFDSEEAIKRGVKLLDETVVSFTTNPLFRAANVVDVEEGTKASRDLDQIIDLSKKLKKAISKLPQ